MNIVNERTGGRPNFRGPFVQGPPAGRFIEIARLTDIRTGANAAATIYMEHLESNLRLDGSGPDHNRLATALMRGIRSEA